MADQGMVQDQAGQVSDPVVDLTRKTCARCGAPARVCVLEGYRNGEPIMGYYCLNCPVDPSHSHGVSGPARARLSVPVLICLAAMTLAVLGGGADIVTSEANPGFGWYQRMGVIAGIVLTFVGVLLRVDLLALGGVIIFGGALTFDFLSLGGSPGIGWKQQVLLVLSAVLLVTAVGIEITFRIRRRGLQKPEVWLENTGRRE